MVSKNIKFGTGIVLILNFIVLLYSFPYELKKKEKNVNLNPQLLKLTGEGEPEEVEFKKSTASLEKNPWFQHFHFSANSENLENKVLW